MKKLKKKYIGLVLKGGGVSIELTENLNENQVRFIENRFGKEYFTTIKAKVENDNNTEGTN